MRSRRLASLAGDCISLPRDYFQKEDFSHQSDAELLSELSTLREESLPLFILLGRYSRRIAAVERELTLRRIRRMRESVPVTKVKPKNSRNSQQDILFRLAELTGKSPEELRRALGL